MLDLAGRVPDPGDSVEVDGFRLTAVDVRGRRIGRVRIEATGAPSDAEAPATPTARAPAALRTTGTEDGALGLRGRGRPPQRRQVHPRERHGRARRWRSPRRGRTRRGIGSSASCTTRPTTPRWSSSTRRASTAPAARWARRLNETATDALNDVDVIMVIVDGTAAIGPGDRTVLERSVRQVQRVTAAAARAGRAADRRSDDRRRRRRPSTTATQIDRRATTKMTAKMTATRSRSHRA